MSALAHGALAILAGVTLECAGMSLANAQQGVAAKREGAVASVQDAATKVPDPAPVSEPQPAGATSPAKSKGKGRPKHAAIPSGGRQVPVEPARPIVETSAEERGFWARMDAALAALGGSGPSQADLASVTDAIRAISAGNAARALELEAAITDPAARKLVRWAAMRSDSSVASPTEIEEFRRANPDFPEQSTLRLRAEEAVLLRVGDVKEIRAFFEKAPPQTGAGLAALGAAALGEGNRSRAQELAAKAWREFDMSLRVETVFLNTLGGLLSEADHKARLDRLLMKDIRWAKERNDRINLVRRVVPYLSAPEQLKAQARIAVYLRQKDAPRLIMSLPADAMQDWGVYFSVVQLNRRAGTTAEEDDATRIEDAAEAGAREGEPKPEPGKLKEAWRLLLAAPSDPARIVSPDDWWIERRINAYEALRAGQARTAYDLVRNPGPLSVNPLKDAQFLAGWIALRHLKDVKAAAVHFHAMRKGADGPISVATAEYWLGRTAMVAGDRAGAERHWRNAMPFLDTFYGQLARQSLEPGGTSIKLGLPKEPTVQERDKFLSRDAVKALAVARRAGQDSMARTFLAHLRHFLVNTPGEIALVAHLSHTIGDTQWSLRAGKAALAKGHNLLSYAFPTHAFPGYQPLRPPAETALLLGIARQESEFNTLTFSGAGARGVLQVMPVTARHVCRDYKIKCDIPRLSSDAAYNAMLASAYIGDRMAEFSGSYVMTLAGYNAGPGRVRQWVRSFGDPRSPDVDPIDWIESIPFEETREYVKKVLANIQVYRARLGQPEQALQIMADLNRARGPASGPAARNQE